MSDPVSNAEIEDVLSSIRRLVSVDDRPDTQVGETRDSCKITAAKPSQQEVGNRLVLTPALRVDASNSKPESESESQAGTSLSAQANAEQDRDENNPEEKPLWCSHNDCDGDSRDLPEKSTEQVSVEEAGSKPFIGPEQMDDTPYVLDQTQAADPVDAPGLGDRIAEVEAAVAARNDQWEPDGASDDAYAGGAVSPMAWEDYGPEPACDDANADGGDAMDDAGDTVLGMKNTGAQANGEPQDQLTGSGSQKAETSAQDAWKTSDGSDDVNLWDDDRADAIIDEALLRDLVSEIVRQELQGALGERITRNVRKLVRREIHRALSSHELD